MRTGCVRNIYEGLDLESMSGHLAARVREQRADHRVGIIQSVNSGDNPLLESREGVEHCGDEHIARQAAGKIEVQMQGRPLRVSRRRLR